MKRDIHHSVNEVHFLPSPLGRGDHAVVGEVGYERSKILPHPSLALLVPPVSPAGSGTSGSDSPPECHSIPSVSLRYPEGKVVDLCLFCCLVVGAAFRRDARPRPTICAISPPLSSLQPIIHYSSAQRLHYSLFIIFLPPSLRFMPRGHFDKYCNSTRTLYVTRDAHGTSIG